MKTYSEFAPSGFDTRGLNLPDRQEWLVHPCGTNRDADVLTRSNWDVACADLLKLDPEGDDHEVHRFGHWACGWFEIVLVRPETLCATDAKQTEAALSDYPVLCDSHFSDAEQTEADAVWLNCYSVSQRIEYIRDHAEQFEFRSFADMLGCVRGNYFGGYASELCS